MKKIILGLTIALAFIGCNSTATEEVNVEPKLVVGKSLEAIELKDQFDVSHTVTPDTYRLIFAFDKEPAHTCNDFFNTKEAEYLQKHHAAFIADVSAAPSIIRSLFILPGLKDFKHQVLLLDKEEVAAPYRANMDASKIVVVYILNNTIEEIRTVTTAEELRKILEDDSPMSFIAPVVNEMLDTTKKMLN